MRELDAAQKTQLATQRAQEEGARPAEGIRARAKEGVVSVAVEAEMGKLVRTDNPRLYSPAALATRAASQRDQPAYLLVQLPRLP
jgi:hypothetical protein